MERYRLPEHPILLTLLKAEPNIYQNDSQLTRCDTSSVMGEYGGFFVKMQFVLGQTENRLKIIKLLFFIYVTVWCQAAPLAAPLQRGTQESSSRTHGKSGRES